MKTFNRVPLPHLAEISTIIGDTVNIEGRICEVFQKAQQVRPGWGSVLTFEVYDSELEQSYKLFANGLDKAKDFNAVINVWVYTDQHSCSLFTKAMELTGGYTNNTDAKYGVDYIVANHI